ncbi:MAG: hypothetical protein EHM18_04440 [Acidobacteria bacterium]|nr:MAG: hypothetical protein EHM18_04440 [Acidobacteriota bacterium]
MQAPTRTDLSNWLVHFVHDRNPENDPSQFFVGDIPDRDYMPVPIGFKKSGEPMFTDWDSYEEHYGTLEPDAPAISVLQNIVRQGFLRAGWSFRDQKATIYGPWPVVCFTEMPFYALLDYARTRSNDGLVSTYGIALLRSELFAAGARPVIYGLSTAHKEADGADPYAGKGFRCLAQSCALGLEEQYRYVATRLTGSRPIDWTHEREWRWPLAEPDQWVPGLPVWLNHEKQTFSQVVVFVNTGEEVDQILGQLKLLHDRSSNQFDSSVDRALAARARVISLEELREFANLETVRFDELPFHQLKKIPRVKASDAVKQKVASALAEAARVAEAAGRKALATANRTKYGNIADVCGRADVITYETGTEVTAALLELKVAEANDDGYILRGLDLPFLDQALCIAEASAIAAAEYLTQTLGQKFYDRSRVD